VIAPEGLVIGGDAVYVYGFAGRLAEIDAAANEVVRKFKPDQGPWTFAAGSYWGSDGKDLLRLAPDTFAPIERWQIPGAETGYADLAFDDGSVWLLREDGPLLRIELR
jgi:hypothetical protein